MILIALGANLPGPYGSPEQTLEQARRSLAERDIHVVRSSRIWASAPVPPSGQPWYRNAVIEVITALPMAALLKTLKQVEKDFGRESDERNAPRILDLDLLAYHGDISDRPDLYVPHPRMHERAFVLLPLQEVAPDWIHPVLRQSVEQMIERLPPGQEISPLEVQAA